MRCYNVLEKFALWIVQFLETVFMTISRWISSAGQAMSDVDQAIRAVIQAILIGTVIVIITFAALLLLRILVLALVKLYQLY